MVDSGTITERPSCYDVSGRPMASQSRPARVCKAGLFRTPGGRPVEAQPRRQHALGEQLRQHRRTHSKHSISFSFHCATRPRHCAARSPVRAARPKPAQRVPDTAQRVPRPHNASPALRSASNSRTARPKLARRVQSAHGASKARTERPIPARRGSHPPFSFSRLPRTGSKAQSLHPPFSRDSTVAHLSTPTPAPRRSTVATASNVLNPAAAWCCSSIAVCTSRGRDTRTWLTEAPLT